MRILGRLILLAVGGFLLYLSISSIISSWQTIQSLGWEGFFSKDTWGAISQILLQAFYALCGLYSVFLGLRGKSTFVSFIAAAILITIVVFKSIDFFKSSEEKTWQNIFNLILTYTTPIGYSVGVLLLTMGKNKD